MAHIVLKDFCLLGVYLGCVLLAGLLLRDLV